MVDSFGFYWWNGAGLVADVQDMLDNPGNNLGWVIRQAELGDLEARRSGSKGHLSTVEQLAPEITYIRGGKLAMNVHSQSLTNSTGGIADISVSAGCDHLDRDFHPCAGPTPLEFGLFFSSASQASGGAGVAFGEGLGAGGEQSFCLPVILARSGQFNRQADFNSVPTGTSSSMARRETSSCGSATSLPADPGSACRAVFK